MSPSWLAGAVGLGIAFFLIKSRWNYQVLPELPSVQTPTPPDLVVIIPARNEEANIARVISSLGEADVLVVDDHSEDRTAELARASGARVIRAPPVRAGVLGKPNACLAGARASTSRWLVFIDADTCYRPNFLASLLVYAESQNLSAASVFLQQECRTAFEKLLLPYAFALYFCGVSSKRVNNPDAAEALANGQCLLFRREAYDLIQGHRAALGSVIEDVALAQVLKRHRLPARVLRAEHLGSVRMYDGFAAIWRGFQKNSFRFLLVNKGSGLQVIAASILLTSYLPVLLWLIADEAYPAAVVFGLLPSALLAPWYNTFTVLLAPLAIYLFQLVALNGMITTALGIKADWKGRRV